MTYQDRSGLEMDHSQHTLNDQKIMGANHGEHMLDKDMTTAASPHAHHVSGAGGMHMFFHGGFNEVILFEEWKISTIGGLLGSMVAIFVVALIYEGLKYYREYLFWKTNNVVGYKPVAVPDRNRDDENGGSSSQAVHFVGEPAVARRQPTMMTWMHLYQTLLHFVQITLSFALMLVFMTYNVWLCLALVLGATTGYFLFCWRKSVFIDVNETCH